MYETLAAVAVAEPTAAEPAAPARLRGALVDAALRDAALALLGQLAVHAPGLPAHGAIRAQQTPAHVDPGGRAWHQVPARAVNLSVAEALRVAPRFAPLAGDWLRWQARHLRSTGPGRGVVLDHWVRSSDLCVAAGPPGGQAAYRCDVDPYGATIASLLLVADAYQCAVGDAVLLCEPGVRAALAAAAGTLDALTRPERLLHGSCLMEVVEIAAGWRAWSRVQQAVFGDMAGARAARAAAARTEDAVRLQFWHGPSGGWRIAVEAGPPAPWRWYPDTVAQAWPLLWNVAGPTPEAAAEAWRRAAAHWCGPRDWSRRNVDPGGFWWPATAAAALCAGDTSSARTWVARARAAWLGSAQPFAWPFHVGDLRWLFWMADPVVPR